MKEINSNTIINVINDNKSVVLIWTDGCKACILAKEYYENISLNYPQFEFYKMQYSQDVLPLYKKLVQEEEIVFPNFLIFDKRNIEETNEYGFVGNVSGLDINYLEVALQSVG